MKTAVIVFPGSNCDRDVAVALQAATGAHPQMVWHGESALPRTDLIVLPGGFSYGDYLRSGAMAAHSPIMQDVKRRADQGTPVLGICNGFQMLTEAGLLPGVLMRNASLRFICRDVTLRIDRADTPFTEGYAQGQIVTWPIAHKDGNFFADDEALDCIEGEGLVALRYVDVSGAATDDANPNGSRHNIAGLINARGNVLGMMPHPERLADPALGGADGAAMFTAIARTLN